MKSPRAKRSRFVPKRTRSHRAKTALALVVLVAAVVGVYAALNRHVQPVAQAPPPLTYREKQSSDVVTLAGAIGQYTGTNGALPTRISRSADGTALVLCGTGCDPINSQVSGLQVYAPSGVHIVPYDQNLTVPDKHTIYLVAGAHCNGNSGIGVQNLTSPKAMVLLYAAATTPGLTQRCIVL
jgi:hypothetical protein